MVAISLYKGNLHKVPDVPRRWIVPTPSISVETFKILIHRRSLALARLQASGEDAAAPSKLNPASSSNPNDFNADPVPANNSSDEIKVSNRTDDSLAGPKLPPRKESMERKEEKVPEENRDLKNDKLIGAEDSLKEMVDKSEAKAEVPVNPVVERNITEDATSDKEKRKKEIKERLEILNEKKHSLVQVLKQILNAEEQLKRQNNVQQGISGRPPLPLQVDTTTDSGSMTKLHTPRLGTDGNPCGDVDGGEGDDVSNQNAPSRHLPRMSSTSPSSESQLRKPGSNMAPHGYRTTLGIVGSPRFAPAGQVLSVSVSGTNYVASSPSPFSFGWHFSL